jgi:hypothetical protein
MESRFIRSGDFTPYLGPVQMGRCKPVRLLPQAKATEELRKEVVKASQGFSLFSHTLSPSCSKGLKDAASGIRSPPPDP